MLIAHTRLIKCPVMSLQTGAELAKTNRVLIDPRNLTVVAYELEGNMLDESPSFLRVDDIRELSNLGFIVDSSDEFIGLDDVIKIRQVYDFSFKLIDLPVMDDKKHKLGKIQGYNIDADGFTIQQLLVKRPFLRSFSDTELLIHRSQVLEVSNERILVRSTARTEPAAASPIREYTNPFRQQNTQPEASTRH